MINMENTVTAIKNTIGTAIVIIKTETGELIQAGVRWGGEYSLLTTC